VSLRRNTEAFNTYDLLLGVLAGMASVDLSTVILGRKIKLPFMLSPTAMQCLYHHEGELAVAKVTARLEVMYGVSTMATRSIEEIASCTQGLKFFQLYAHKNKELTSDLIARCKNVWFDALALTVDTVVSGDRELDLRSRMTTSPKLSLKSLLSFAAHPDWPLNYLFRDKFDLANVSKYIKQGTDVSSSVTG